MKSELLLQQLALRGVRFCILATFTLIATVNAQPPDTVWTQIINNGTIDLAMDIDLTSDGGFVVAGAAQQGGMNLCGFLAHLNQSGDTLWTRSICDSGLSAIHGIESLADGSHIFCGTSYLQGRGDAVTASHVFNDGTVDWIRRYDDLQQWIGFDICITSDQCIAVAGGTPFSAGRQDAVILKLDIEGNIIWYREFGGPYSEHFESISETEDFGLIATGYGAPGAPAVAGYYIARVNSDGDSLWTRLYQWVNASLWPHKLIAAQDGGYLIVGDIDYGADQDILAVRIDAQGDSLWSRTYGGPDIEFGNGGDALDSNGFLLCGSTRSYGNGLSDIYAIGLDSSGDTLWTKTLGADSWDYATSVQVLNAEEFITTGVSYRADSYDIFVARWAPIENSTIQPTHGNPSQLALLTAYPNPFNVSSTLSFTLFHALAGRLTVYDMSGRVVTVLAEKSYPVGEHRIIVDGKGLASGIYFAQLTAGSQTATQKLLLIR